MTSVLDVAREALPGAPAWIVGGAVRDRLLGREVTDLDIVVAGDPRAAARAVAKTCGGPAFELSERFGAWRVVSTDRTWQIDVMQLQGDSIEADLGRRDFTVNAIAQPLDGGDLLDPHGGERDLGAEILRAVSPSAFSDDPLRVIRLVRFAAELGLAPDSVTAADARECAPRLASVAAERVFAELRRIVAAAGVLDALDQMETLGVTAAVLPELIDLRALEQNHYHHLDAHTHTMETLANVIRLQRSPDEMVGSELARDVADLLAAPFSDELTRGTALRFGALLHDIAKPRTQARDEEGSVMGFPGHAEEGAAITRDVLTRLRSSDRLRSHVQGMVLHHLLPGYLVREDPLGPRAIHRYLVTTGPVAVDVVLLSIADRLATGGHRSEVAIPRHLDVAQKLLRAAIDWERDGPPRPLVRGDELAAALDLAPGPQLGTLLGALAEAQYAGEITTQAEAIDHARALSGGE